MRGELIRRRRRRRHVLEAGDGITLAVSARGPLDPRTAEALRVVARAAAEQLRADPGLAARARRTGAEPE